MGSKKDGLLIAMLRIGAENITTGITRKNMMDQLRQRKIEGAFFDEDHVSLQFEHFWTQLFPPLKGLITEKKDEQHLSIEGHFQLLEYEELEEARASSKKALWVAISAIVISIISTVALTGWSIYTSNDTKNVQFTDAQPVRIEEIAKVKLEDCKR